MNVRCPHCSAVFPAGPSPQNGEKTVECPLCLLRFEATPEATQSVAQAPAPQPRGYSNDDEFERYGGGTGTGAVAAAKPGLTVPLASSRAGPVVTARNEPELDLGVDVEEDIDFDSLLSDAVGAVEKHEKQPSGIVAPAPAGRTNPFARISAPRAGVGVAAGAPVESVFGPERPASRSSQAIPALKPETQAPTQVLAGGSGNPFQPFSNPNATSDFLGGFGGGAPPEGSAPSVQVPKSEDDSLFESSAGNYARQQDDDLPARRSGSPGHGKPAPQLGQAAKGTAKKRGPVLSFDRLLGLAMALAVVGIATDYLGLGLFASKLWRPEPPPTAKVERTLPKDLATPVVLDDTRTAYELELARLDKVLRLRPDDAGLQRRRANIYLDLLERYPEALQDQPEVKKGFEQLQKTGKLAGPRLLALEAMSHGDIAAALKQYDALKIGSADDRGTAARVQLADFVARLERQALDAPGLTAAADVDPLRMSGADDAALVQSKQMLDLAVGPARGTPSFTKLVVLQAEIADHMALPAEVSASLEPLVQKAGEHLDARLLLASALMDSGRTDDAQKQIDQVTLALAGDLKAPSIPRKMAFVQARQAAKHGDREGQLQALATLVAANPGDELAVVRLARLQMTEKHLDEAHRLLATSKKSQKFKSVAFVVVSVEYWLTVNRTDDAMAELTAARKLYKDSLELEYLGGQVEDKQQRFATARDSFAKVLQKEPRHLRASIRLAELQSQGGRHDDALATLERARASVGDEENILRLLAEELAALKREPEARTMLDKLLALAPDNRRYLLRAAQMDLAAGNADRALDFLRKLRAQKALDRPAAIQLAKALAEKKSFSEAAGTVEPFADQSTSDVEVNTLTGQLYLDAGEVERATVYISRAVQTANGKNAEALFQYGRLAFKRGDVASGTSRIRQAIGQDPLAHTYRYELAKYLLDVKNDANARSVAVEELETIERSAEGLAGAGHPVKYLADVHRQLARATLAAHEYQRAVRHLKEVLAAAPDDIESKSELGRALYYLADPQCGKVLREVLARRPGDARAAMYLGLNLLNKHQSVEALTWLQQAGQSSDKRLAEAWYHIALIYKERDQLVPAMRAIDMYLERADKDDTYHADAESLRRSLASLSSGKKKPK